MCDNLIFISSSRWKEVKLKAETSLKRKDRRLLERPARPTFAACKARYRYKYEYEYGFDSDKVMPTSLQKLLAHWLFPITR